MKLTHYNSQEEIVKVIVDALTKHLELKAQLNDKIKKAHGGEEIALIKRYNGLFVFPYGTEKRKRGDL